MSDYGLTPQGPNIKRLDVILEDLHTKLSDKWGVNTKQNPESFINHFLTNIADSLAELWEFGENIYYSQYPSSAEGASLDNVAQLGGCTRENATKSYYPIHCTGTDGTTLASGTMISSTTNPATFLSLVSAKQISRNTFNKAVVKVASAAASTVYSVAINGSTFSITSSTASETDIITALKNTIVLAGFTVTKDTTGKLLTIESTDLASSNALTLSSNLTTDSVTSVINFGTVETGNISLPNGVITNIVSAGSGLRSVVNLCDYVAGRNDETDIELRKSYSDKIFSRSTTMLESIKSAILNNVPGVSSVVVYENDTNSTDASSRPAHSIEIVVDGGDSTEIAKKILEKKAAGISTYGSVQVTLSGEYDENIVIRFSRPTVVYAWFNVTITMLTGETAPSNYASLIKNVILDRMDELGTGDDIIPQHFVNDIYNVCPGIAYVDISVYATTDSSVTPQSSDYVRTATITARQRAYTTSSKIGVGLSV